MSFSVLLVYFHVKIQLFVTLKSDLDPDPDPKLFQNIVFFTFRIFLPVSA
jgi:hypothetical protein